MGLAAGGWRRACVVTRRTVATHAGGLNAPPHKADFGNKQPIFSRNPLENRIGQISL